MLVKHKEELLLVSLQFVIVVKMSSMWRPCLMQGKGRTTSDCPLSGQAIHQNCCHHRDPFFFDMSPIHYIYMSRLWISALVPFIPYDSFHFLHCSQMQNTSVCHTCQAQNVLLIWSFFWLYANIICLGRTSWNGSENSWINRPLAPLLWNVWKEGTET